MKRKQGDIKPKTSVCIYVETLTRLKSHMKYGDTVNGMVDKLLDAYDKINPVETKVDNK